MTEPVVLSGSSMSTYLKCGMMWRFAYVDRIKSPPALKPALGIAAHNAIEVDLRQKMETKVDIPKEQMLDVFRDGFVKETEYSEEPEAEIGAMLDSGVAAVDFWYDRVGVQTQPTMVEIHGQFTIKSGDGTAVPYDWTADLVDEDDWGLTRIRDWKFVGRTPNSSDSYILPMTGYALGYRRLTGKIEDSRQLDHIVRLKKPTYVPIEDGPVTDAEIRAFADIVGDVYAQIHQGRFVPNGIKNGTCSYCGYWKICPAISPSMKARRAKKK